MKNKIVLVSLVLVSLAFCIYSVSAIDVSVDNYYPTPAQAGDYFTVWLTVANNEASPVSNAIVRFKDAYPFSLDPTENKDFSTDIAANSVVLKQFKVRVDQAAVEGTNDMLFEYANCPSCVFTEKSLPITVVEYQTTFDAVLQQITSDGVFIAIANIGKNAANAITVRIPEQEYFKTDLTSASIVGNLASGDYTIAGFKISPKYATNQTLPAEAGSGQAGFRTRTAQSANQTASRLAESSVSHDLVVQIDYTDVFGVRRTVIKQIPLNSASLSGVSASTLAARTSSKTGTSPLSDTWFWVTVVLALVVIGIWLKGFYKRRKRIP